MTEYRGSDRAQGQLQSTGEVTEYRGSDRVQGQ